MRANHRSSSGPLERAVRLRTEREQAARHGGIGSIVQNLGLMGFLGWLIVTPPLLLGFFGRWLDRSLGTGIQLTAALLMVGIGIGGWLAWRPIRDAGLFGGTVAGGGGHDGTRDGKDSKDSKNPSSGEHRP